VAQGATCEKIIPDKRLCDIALQSVRLLKMDYAGVDIIEDRAGHLVVIEINSVPAWKGLESVCEQNIAQLLANDLVNRLILKKT
jgi:glutathione synthase/RimK-type ligase-like ATP-grasp enzyme